ncbi:unnamed protein product [Adineta steineri]|uniref:Uncharacterized protein n=1 Tax=Adineta steineri TaxID=433720 RepID=A0A814BLL3_9BILA|nr:unnamed protein product [Adineta steineri]CAF1075816.1 unnamed protein product [Adineta steineri]CAF3615887.1 unnamed protein product [Adineta steineri]CAF3688857.1 unnamed protein product [Adineta steineri]
MITETRQSRTRLLQYEYHHRHHRRRHHTLDSNSNTLDKFNFICVPLHPHESRIDSSSSQKKLTMTQQTHRSPSISSTLPLSTSISPATRRVRFKFEDNDLNQNKIFFNTNRQTLSSEDVRLSQKNPIHRVEFQIPLHKDINPWLNVDCSTPAKTRSISSKKIDIKHNNNSMRLQHITPFIEPEVHSHTPTTNDVGKNQSQWYRQMYGNLHKSPEIKQDHQQNPYKPTYTFPDNFNGDSDHMEDYIRKTAIQTIDKDNQKTSFSPTQTLTSSLKDHRTTPKRNNGHIEKVTRFDDYCTQSDGSSPTERRKLNNDTSSSSCVPSSINNNLQSNSNHMSTSDNEQKSIYKRILCCNDVTSNDLQKFSNNDRGRRTYGLFFFLFLFE